MFGKSIIGNFLKKSHINTIIIVFFCYSNFGYCQSYNSGFNYYVEGKYEKAIEDLKHALEKSNKTEKVQIYKIIAISNYMLGKKEEAEKIFFEALKRNKEMSISPGEILDPNILDFFNATKKKYKLLLKKKKAFGFIKVVANKNQEYTIDRKKFSNTRKIKVPIGKHEIVYSSSKGEKVVKSIQVKRNKTTIETIAVTSTTLPTTQKKSIALNFTPFGIKSFTQKKHIIGTVFAVSQISGISLGLLKYFESIDTADESNKKIDELNSLAKDYKEYEKEQNIKIDESYNMALVGFGVAGLSYLINIIYNFTAKNKTSVTPKSLKAQIPLQNQWFVQPILTSKKTKIDYPGALIGFRWMLK